MAQHAAIQYVEHHMTFATKLALSLVYIPLAVIAFGYSVDTTNQALKGSGLGENPGLVIQIFFTVIESRLFFGSKGTKKHWFVYLALGLDSFTNFYGLWKSIFKGFKNWEVLGTVCKLPLLKNLIVNRFYEISVADLGDFLGFTLALLLAFALAPITEFFLRETVDLWRKSD